MTETPNTQSEWQEWPTIKDFMRHVGDMVDVMRRGTDNVLLRGRVTSYSESLRRAGIIQFGNYGLDTSGQSIVCAVPLPRFVLNPHDANAREENKERYAGWSRQYLFRVVDPEAGKS